jgi:hypothetical protein
MDMFVVEVMGVIVVGVEVSVFAIIKDGVAEVGTLVSMLVPFGVTWGEAGIEVSANSATDVVAMDAASLPGSEVSDCRA